MEHIVEFEAGHDCIRFECVNGSKNCAPGSGGSHGKHGLGIRFVAKGGDGAVQFLIYTGWLPQHTKKDAISWRLDWGSHGVMPADLGYHSKTPRYEDQSIQQGVCEYCDGQPCYYDGSGLNAERAMYALVNGGDKALWEFLEAYYAATFAGGAWPEPAEYRKPLRAA